MAMVIVQLLKSEVENGLAFKGEERYEPTQDALGKAPLHHF